MGISYLNKGFGIEKGAKELNNLVHLKNKILNIQIDRRAI
jgi:hypothetical protein